MIEQSGCLLARCCSSRAAGCRSDRILADGTAGTMPVVLCLSAYVYLKAHAKYCNRCPTSMTCFTTTPVATHTSIFRGLFSRESDRMLLPQVHKRAASVLRQEAAAATDPAAPACTAGPVANTDPDTEVETRPRAYGNPG